MTEIVKMPTDNRIVGGDGRLNKVYQGYFGIIETLANNQATRVAEHVPPATATAQQIAEALIAAGLMKGE